MTGGTAAFWLSEKKGPQRHWPRCPQTTEHIQQLPASDFSSEKRKTQFNLLKPLSIQVQLNLIPIYKWRKGLLPLYNNTIILILPQ